ncbi:MAG: HlyC/CorC family transporter [Deltaproteobacteria bacterium]|nr:HlyC/CorC family transporter [Deltaproteobacteria bacterium]
MESLLFWAAIIFILIIINGFFSGAEIAIISSKRSLLDKLVKDGNSSAAIVNSMKEKPERFIATVQIGITLVATLASAIGGIIAIEFIQPRLESIALGADTKRLGEYVSVAVVVFVISYVTLVIGELVPKSLGLRFAEKTSCFAARPIEFLSKITSSFIRLLTASNNAVLRMFGIKGTEKGHFVSEEEIKFYIREGKASGVFEETEAALLHGIFEFADTTVKEVMVPKPRFSAIEISMPTEKVLRFLTETGFSRYPVYRESPENVVGVLFNKDVLRAIERGRPFVLSELLRAPYFVPNTVMISRLLRELQRRKIHMAIVVDEHGEVDGLVTIEDILEEIVGEIEDEYDVDKGGFVEKLKDGTLVIDASVSLRDLEDVGIVFDEDTEEYHTLAGFMLAKLQRIPRGGEFVVSKGRRFTVVDVEANRIVKIKVEQLPVQKTAEAR